MTRHECERQIAEKLVEIIDIYHQYNPDGKYLAMFYSGDEEQHISFNNRYWNIKDNIDSPGEDVHMPLNYSRVIEEG